MGDQSTPKWDLAAQVTAMENWLTSPAGGLAATRLMRKYGLSDDPQIGRAHV
mgnify:CR=1 FL=1